MDSCLAIERYAELETSQLREFKAFTNRVVGRGLLVPENNHVFFGYRESHRGLVRTLVCVGTCRPAFPDGQASVLPNPSPASEKQNSNVLCDRDVEQCVNRVSYIDIGCDNAATSGSASPSTKNLVEEFLDDASHVIEYLFTDPYYRRSGYGNQVLRAMEDHCRMLNAEAPIKLWSASKARSFFRRFGFVQVSNTPITSVHSIFIFRTLYPMIKYPYAPGTVRRPYNPSRKHTSRPQARKGLPG